jgi:hypothetical protein
MCANDKLKIICCLFAFCGHWASGLAQTKKGEKVAIQTFDGNEFQGELLEDVTKVLVLKTKILGKVTIEQKNVQSIRLLEAAVSNTTIISPEMPTQSNPNTTWVIIEATDGNHFEGELLEETDTKISIKTKMLGKITLNLSEVRSIRLIKEGKTSESVVMPSFENTPPMAPVEEAQVGMTFVETKEGNQFMGLLDDTYPDKVVLETRMMGKVSVAKRKIRRLQPITAHLIHAEELWQGNSNYYRNIMTPTAIGLRAQEGVLRNTDILFTGLTYGVNKHWTVEMGFDLLSLLTFSSPSLLYIMPQYHKEISKNTHMGLGLYVGVHGEVRRVIKEQDMFLTEEKISVTDVVPFSTFTYGSTESNITLGVGYRFMDGKLGQSPVVTLGGQYRLNKSWMLVGEVMNQKLSTGLRDPDNPEVLFPIVNFGVRYLTRRYVFDFGVSRSKTYNQENNGGNTAPATEMGTRPVLTVAMPFYKSFK